MVDFKDVCHKRVHTLVNKTEVKDIKGDRYYVSTVRLPIDHQHKDEGEPIFYETMVFAMDSNDNVDYLDLHCTRYYTLQEAVVGHDNVCQATVKGELK